MTSIRDIPGNVLQEFVTRYQERLRSTHTDVRRTACPKCLFDAVAEAADAVEAPAAAEPVSVAAGFDPIDYRLRELALDYAIRASEIVAVAVELAEIVPLAESFHDFLTGNLGDDATPFTPFVVLDVEGGRS